jgi:hypothetical protein
MSLKGFHVIFIAVAALFSLGFSGWALTAPAEVAPAIVRGCGWASAVIGVSLVLYGLWFVIKKSKKLIV